MRRFKSGDVVRVKCFKKRPKHWNNRGKMDKYMGRVVTIKSFNEFDNEYKIDDDVFGWYWQESDFEEVVENFLEDKDVLI